MGLNKTELKEVLECQYTLVARLATSPADFYNGRNEALIAHPGFPLTMEVRASSDS